jgi:multiple sugar transport system ATP-binding protein
MAHIRIDKVTKRFGANTALDAMSLDIADGEFFVLLGPTGAGKTTTLRLIAGLEKPDSGTVEIAGEDVREWSAAERDVALVFQYYSLYPRYTVRENLAFPLKSRIRHFSPAEIAERIDKAAKVLRIDHLLDRKTDRLSGGEMQRVSIGRAIVREPRAFLMDEPLSNLDAKLREALRSELKDLQMKLGATFLYVTHDQIEAMSMGDKIGILDNGRIVQIGTPNEIYTRPNSVFVARFVGSPAMNLFPGEIAGGQVTALSGKLKVATPFKATGAVTVGVRSEDVAVSPTGALEGKIEVVENHGVEKIVSLRVGETLLKATTPSSLATAAGAVLRFDLISDRIHCFDGPSGRSLAA